MHFFECFLPLVFVLAFARVKGLWQVFASFFIGFLFAYFAFFIAANSLQTSALYFYANILFIACGVVAFVLSVLKFELLLIRLSLITLINFAFGVRYFYIS